MLRYLDAASKIADPVRALDVALEIGPAGEMNRPRRLDWPSVRNPNDGWMLDLARNAAADYIVTRGPHLMDAEMPFPVEIPEPQQLLSRFPH